MDQTTAPDLDEAIGASPGTLPLIRPMRYPAKLGRLWTAGLDRDGQPTAEEFEQVWLRVTPRGHSWMATDPSRAGLGIVCRGCELPVFEGMDSVRCRRPATHQDVASALLADMPRPAPRFPVGQPRGIRFITADGDWVEVSA